MFNGNNRSKQNRRKLSDRRTGKLDELLHHAVSKGVFMDTRKNQRRKSLNRRKQDLNICLN